MLAVSGCRGVKRGSNIQEVDSQSCGRNLTTLSDQRYPALDALRMFAALAVVMFHYLYYYPAYANAFPKGLREVASHGYLGVQLFFMISGYVITLSAIGRTRAEFALARFIRLWPAFVICLIFTSLAKAVSGDVPALGTILVNVTMVPRVFGVGYLDDVYWSLMFEIFFYVAVAMLLAGSSDFVRRLRIFAVAWLLLAVAGSFIDVAKIKTLLVLDFAPFFIVGVAIFLVRNGGNALLDKVLLAGALGASVAFAMAQARGVGDAVFSAASPDVQAALSSRIRPSQYLCGAVIVVGAMALFASTFVVKMNARQARLALALGGISYPLYLLHNGFGSALINLLPASTTQALAVGLGVVVGICFAIWKLEVPLRRRLSVAVGTRRRIERQLG